ncbi:hypothetical protein BU25DRAFT_453781 [Macroventuria anomochaeta]|uniref:Uncharacterized protein n=1 Tax=Macroventuria anomochaeta TaxID=301207 RepID=A0ACB6SE29_9PLEO|nr:uncharacterized protein BU25DRAFT_453781 [Macroventuria anomochaeta]KAF2632571.1 hypothetical protein BU25DRAFT_453781 [Macroventuria anomochaeta]
MAPPTEASVTSDAPIIDKYKHADDLVEIEVQFSNKRRQKVLISRKALSAENKLGEASKVDSTIKDESLARPSPRTRSQRDSKIVDSTCDEKAVQQSKTATQKEEVKRAETLHVSTEKKSNSSAAKSAVTRSSKKAAAPKSIANKPTVTSQEVTTKLSEDASRGSMTSTFSKETATAKDKVAPFTQKTVVPTSRVPTTTQAPSPLAARKTPKDTNVPAPTKPTKSHAATSMTESPTSKCNANGNCIDKGNFVRPDTPRKLAEPVLTRKPYNEAAKSSVRNAPAATPTADIDGRATLQDKANKRKSAPWFQSKPSADTSTPSQPAKPLEPTSKRQRATEDTHPTERPTKKLATKQTAIEDINHVDSKPAVESNADALVDAISSPELVHDQLAIDGTFQGVAAGKQCT